MKSDKPFLPALDYHWLTPCYDAVLGMGMPEQRLRGTVLDAIRNLMPERILDVGCGTGTQLLLARNALPSSAGTGIDVDTRILSRARQKGLHAGCPLSLACARATALPFADHTFDLLISILVLHHLTEAEKRLCVAEAFRVLRIGGELHIADFGVPGGALMRAAASLSRVLEDRERMANNIAGLIPVICTSVGFEVREYASLPTVFGTVRMLVCRR